MDIEEFRRLSLLVEEFLNSYAMTTHHRDGSTSGPTGQVVYETVRVVDRMGDVFSEHSAAMILAGARPTDFSGKNPCSGLTAHLAAVVVVLNSEGYGAVHDVVNGHLDAIDNAAISDVVINNVAVKLSGFPSRLCGLPAWEDLSDDVRNSIRQAEPKWNAERTGFSDLADSLRVERLLYLQRVGLGNTDEQSTGEQQQNAIGDEGKTAGNGRKKGVANSPLVKNSEGRGSENQTESHLATNKTFQIKNARPAYLRGPRQTRFTEAEERDFDAYLALFLEDADVVLTPGVYEFQQMVAATREFRIGSPQFSETKLFCVPDIVIARLERAAGLHPSESQQLSFSGLLARVLARREGTADGVHQEQGESRAGTREGQPGHSENNIPQPEVVSEFYRLQQLPTWKGKPKAAIHREIAQRNAKKARRQLSKEQLKTEAERIKKAIRDYEGKVNRRQ